MKKSDKEMNATENFGRCQHYHFDDFDNGKGFRFVRCQNAATGIFKRTKKAFIAPVSSTKVWLDKSSGNPDTYFFASAEIEKMKEVKSYGGKKLHLCDSCLTDWRYENFDMIPCRM